MDEKTIDLSRCRHLPERFLNDPDPPGENGREEPPHFEVDAMTIALVVARIEGGHKVQEYNIQPQRVLYPFDVRALTEAAVAVARKSWEEGAK